MTTTDPPRITLSRFWLETAFTLCTPAAQWFLDRENGSLLLYEPAYRCALRHVPRRDGLPALCFCRSANLAVIDGETLEMRRRDPAIGLTETPGDDIRVVRPVATTERGTEDDGPYTGPKTGAPPTLADVDPYTGNDEAEQDEDAPQAGYSLGPPPGPIAARYRPLPFLEDQEAADALIWEALWAEFIAGVADPVVAWELQRAQQMPGSAEWQERIFSEAPREKKRWQAFTQTHAAWFGSDQKRLRRRIETWLAAEGIVADVD